MSRVSAPSPILASSSSSPPGALSTKRYSPSGSGSFGYTSEWDLGGASGDAANGGSTSTELDYTRDTAGRVTKVGIYAYNVPGAPNLNSSQTGGYNTYSYYANGQLQSSPQAANAAFCIDGDSECETGWPSSAIFAISSRSRARIRSARRRRRWR